MLALTKIPTEEAPAQYLYLLLFCMYKMMIIATRLILTPRLYVEDSGFSVLSYRAFIATKRSRIYLSRKNIDK